LKPKKRSRSLRGT
jgi:hypothetical protein